MKITEHFSMAEFTASVSARRMGIDNDPDLIEGAAIRELCFAVLEPLRAYIGAPITITSGFRSAKLNAAIKGSKTSQHVKGEAADIKVSGMTAEQLARTIVELRLPFDQLIWYAPSRGGHVHVSYAAGRRGRGQVLYAPPEGGYRARSL